MRIKNLFTRFSGSDERIQSYLIVGLGNPGRQFQLNRHNVGFALMNHLTEKLATSFTRMKFNALVTDCTYEENKIIFAKPQTYMNLSGRAVRSLTKFYKIPFEKILVVYDDVDLPFGSLRIRPKGGTGGHQGMKSIVSELGTEDFPRLRIGVGRPPGRKGAANYVLKNFTMVESDFLPAILDRSVDAILTFITQGIAPAMTKYNRNEL